MAARLLAQHHGSAVPKCAVWALSAVMPRGRKGAWQCDRCGWSHAAEHRSCFLCVKATRASPTVAKPPRKPKAQPAVAADFVAPTYAQVAAVAAKSHTPEALVARRWLCDTGCPFDLIGSPGILPGSKDEIRQAKVAATLETANGKMECFTTMPMQIVALRDNIDPYVLESSPDVLSIGRRCVEEGFEFHWPAGSLNPYFVDQLGNTIVLETVGCVPYLVDPHNATHREEEQVMPAAVAKRGATQAPPPVGYRERCARGSHKKGGDTSAATRWTPWP